MAETDVGPKPFWTMEKAVGVFLVVIVVGAIGLGIASYQRGRSASTSGSVSACANGATNFPACNNNVCAYGGTFPSCNPAPTCEYGGVYPNCNPAPTCQYGGTYPNCDPAPSCQYGGTYPNCNPPGPQCKGTAACFSDTVEYVVDGDTLDIGSTRVRLALVNTPEVGQSGYTEAKQFTAHLCPVGSQALVDEDDGQTGGSYGRMVAVVYCGGANLNAELLRSGHAVLLTYYCSVSEFANDAWTGCP